MATYTNQTKNTATWRTAETETGLIWEDATLYWQNATFTWAQIATISYINQAKNTASYTGATKH